MDRQPLAGRGTEGCLGDAAVDETGGAVKPLRVRIRGDLQARGETRSMADMLIAATAQRHQLTLATRNTRGFEGCGIPLFNPFRG